jgi:hypothetical protein
MGKAKLVKKVLTAAEKRLESGAKKLAALKKKKKVYPPKPVSAKMPKVNAADKKFPKPVKKKTKAKAKPKVKAKAKTTRTDKALGWMGSAAKGVKDISSAIGVGGRAFGRSIKNKPVGKLPTKIATHVGKHPGKYGTGSIIGSGVVSNRMGTSKGRRQASKDLKI